MEYKFPNKNRRISTSRLNTLRCVHLKPIYVIISYGSLPMRSIGKSEIRISKYETNSNIQSSKSQTGSSCLEFVIQNFDIVSDFGFRASNFPVLRTGSIPNLEVGFILRCFQNLSLPDIATLRCPWQDSRYTRGQFNSVLSSHARFTRIYNANLQILFECNE